MNSIVLKQNQVWLRFQILTKTRFFAKKNFSKDSKDDSHSDEKKNINGGAGILHDKQQSVKEESYFHKEAKEQLKTLKEKMKDRPPESSDKDEKK